MAGRRRPRPRLKKSRAALSALLVLAALALVLYWMEAKPLGPEPDPDQPAVSQPAVSQPAAAESSREEDPGLEVYFLDVGQGDSELVRYTGKDGVWTMLIDTGEYAYADGLTETLRDLGVERIDALVCSHPHTDHMGCMARIIQRFEVGAFYMPQAPEEMVPTNSAYEALLNTLSKRAEIPVTALHSSAVIDCPEGMELQVLAPRPDAAWEELNNWSAVLRLTYGETSFLFTGDAEELSETAILEDAESFGWELETDVLKCGHHGSSTSSTARLLKAVAPKYAVVSCGKNNDYGHPHRETLKKLDLLETRLYRTDEDGTVLARSDGKTLTWETGLPSVAARTWDD